MTSHGTYYAGGVTPRRPSHTRTSSRDAQTFVSSHPYSRPSPSGGGGSAGQYPHLAYTQDTQLYASAPYTHEPQPWMSQAASTYPSHPSDAMPVYGSGPSFHPVAPTTFHQQYPAVDYSPSIQDLEEFLNDPNLWTPPTASASYPAYHSGGSSLPASVPASSPPTPPEKVCWHCRTRTTPLWRRDQRVSGLLCNACGLYLTQRGKLRPRELIDADDDTDVVREANYTGPECSHCHTRTTSVWRRNKVGDQVCNACGVYERLKGKERPLSLRRDKIRPRNTGND